MFVFSKSKFLDPSFLNPLNLWKSTTGVPKGPRKPPFCSTRGQSPRKPPSYTFLLATGAKPPLTPVFLHFFQKWISKSDFVLFFQKREVDPKTSLRGGDYGGTAPVFLKEK